MAIKLAHLPPFSEGLHLAMGRLVINYNRAEFEIRALLTDLVSDFQKDTRRAHILTSELGSVGLENGIRAIAGDLLPKPERDAIEYGLRHFTEVRGHRNYLVHGVLGSVGEHGQIITYSAKGALSQTVALVTVETIDEMTDHAYSLLIYVKGLRQHLTDRVRPPKAFAPAPLPDRPPMPPKLAKPLLRFRERFPPPSTWPG